MATQVIAALFFVLLLAAPAWAGITTTGPTIVPEVRGGFGMDVSALNGYPKNSGGVFAFSVTIPGSDLVLTATTCTNQFVTAISTTGVGTCTTGTLASAQHANQGTTTTLLHGNAAGNPAWGSVVSADLNITGTTCTNQFIRSLSSAAAGTCATVANADLANSTITLNAGTSTGLTAPGAMTLGSTYTFGAITDTVQFKTLTLTSGTAAPSFINNITDTTINPRWEFQESGAQKIAIQYRGSTGGTNPGNLEIVNKVGAISFQFTNADTERVLLSDSGLKLTLGSDATGDVYYRNASGYFTRVAAGASGTMFRMGGSSIPAWTTATYPTTVTTGDLLYASGANAVGSLAVGAAGTVLVGGTNPSYSSTPSLDRLTLISATTPQININIGNATSFAQIQYQESGTAKTSIQIMGTSFGGGRSGNMEFLINAAANGAYLFQDSGGTTRVRIEAAGNVGVGRTPGFNLDVNGTFGVQGLTGTSVGDTYICWKSSTGEVRQGATCAASVRQIKEGIGPIPEATALARSMTPVRFKYKDAYRNGALAYGFIADDLAAIDERFALRDTAGGLISYDERAVLAVAVQALRDLDDRVAVMEAEARARFLGLPRFSVPR